MAWRDEDGVLVVQLPGRDQQNPWQGHSMIVLVPPACYPRHEAAMHSKTSAYRMERRTRQAAAAFGGLTGGKAKGRLPLQADDLASFEDYPPRGGD